MWPKQEKEKTSCTSANLPLYLAVKMCRYGSLININPSGFCYFSVWHDNRKMAGLFVGWLVAS